MPMKKHLWIVIMLGGAALTGQGWAANKPAEQGDSQRMRMAQVTEKNIMNAQKKQTRIRLLFGSEEVTVALEDNPASRDLVSMLPLTLRFEDYNGTEKISYLPRKLKTRDAPSSCDPSVGSFTYYAPWGNLAIFYHDFRHSDGLVSLGRIEAGMEKLSNMRGDFSVRLEKMD